MKYELEERTSLFGQRVIRFSRKIRADHITRPLLNQLVRSATSIGANYSEANVSSSKRDFRHKVGISRKEANETKHWLKMIAVACPEINKEALLLWNEAHEFVLIFSAIFRSCSLSDKAPKRLRI